MEHKNNDPPDREIDELDATTATADNTAAPAAPKPSFQTKNNILSETELSDLSAWTLHNNILPYLADPIFVTVTDAATKLLSLVHPDLGDRSKALDVFVSRGYGKRPSMFNSLFLEICVCIFFSILI